MTMISSATTARIRSTMWALVRKSVMVEPLLASRCPHQAGQMRYVLEEDPDMRQRPCAHQRLVHIGVPCQLLHVTVPADRDEAFAPLVAAVPVALHQAENPEHAAMHAHEALAGNAQRACIAGL